MTVPEQPITKIQRYFCGDLIEYKAFIDIEWENNIKIVAKDTKFTPIALSLLQNIHGNVNLLSMPHLWMDSVEKVTNGLIQHDAPSDMRLLKLLPDMIMKFGCVPDVDIDPEKIYKLTKYIKNVSHMIDYSVKHTEYHQKEDLWDLLIKSRVDNPIVNSLNTLCHSCFCNLFSAYDTFLADMIGIVRGKPLTNSNIVKIDNLLEDYFKMCPDERTRYTYDGRLKVLRLVRNSVIHDNCEITPELAPYLQELKDNKFTNGDMITIYPAHVRLLYNDLKPLCLDFIKFMIKTDRRLNRQPPKIPNVIPNQVNQE